LIQDNNDGDTIKFFEGVAECLMNDSDTLKDVKIRAKNLAEQNAQQKIVDYIRDFLEFRYLTFPDDEILSIANEIFKISNINYGMKDSGGNEMIIQSTVIAQIDDNDIMNYIVGFFNERIKLKSENDSLREEIDDLKCQIEDLRLQIDELTPQVITKDKLSLINQKSVEAMKLFTQADFRGAIKLYDEAIKISPNANAYYYRGWAYRKIGNAAKAQSDFAKAKQLGYNF